MKSFSNEKFLLGPYEVCGDLCTISDGNTVVKLTPKIMDVLIYMAENAERVITSAELLENFWSRVFSDHPVHKAIADLRHAVGDTVRTQRFIKTLPKRGYKLMYAPSRVSQDYPSSKSTATYSSPVNLSVQMH